MNDTERIETVLGPISASELGIVLPHEHFPHSRGISEAVEPPGDYIPKLERLQREAMREAQLYGVRTLVELTPIGVGRCVPMMQRLSRQTGMHVTAATGLYLEGRRPEWVKAKSAESLAEVFEAELTDHMAGSDARAWMIKVAATDQKKWSASDQKVFRAAALASQRTRAAITTHSCNAAKLHFDFLAESGAQPSRIYIGHADFEDDADLEHVARNGGHLIFTCWGIEHFVKQEELSRKVVRLLEKYPQTVLFSIDYGLAVADNRMDMISSEYECRDRTPGYLFRYALPLLRSKGVGEEILQKCLRDNPREMLLRPGQQRVAEHGGVPVEVKQHDGFEVKAYSAETEADALRVINASLAGWPYTRAIDQAMVEHWKTLGAAWQPQNMLVAYRDGQARAFVHGEDDADGKTHNIHLLGILPGAVAEAVELLAEMERRCRATGRGPLRGPFYRSNIFYGSYVCGCEPYLPHWATDCIEAFVTAGFRISHPAVIMVCDMARELKSENAPAGYEIKEAQAKDEFGARTFRYVAHFESKEVATCGGRLYPALMSPRGGPVGQIGFVGTSEAHRGKGLSRILVEHSLERLKSWGAAEVLIATGLDNFPALRSYERAGFVRRYNINEWSKELK